MEENTLLDEQPTPLVEKASEPQKPEKPPLSPARRRWRLAFKIIGWTFLTLIVCLFLLAAVSVWYVNRWPKPKGDLDTWDFGPNGARGVTLPFTFADGTIHVQGLIGTRPVRFMVDTGSFTSVFPKRLHFGGKQYANEWTMVDFKGTAVYSRPVFFPSVRLGSCTIHNFSAHIPDRYKQSDLPLIGTASKECILGNSALSNVVVTIDYPKHLIIFHPPQQKPMPDAEGTETSYRFTWSDSDDFGNYSGPIIKGESYHHRLNVLFDTGCGNVYIISPVFEHDLLKSGNTSLLAQQVKTNTMYDFMETELTKPPGDYASSLCPRCSGIFRADIRCNRRFYLPPIRCHH